MLQLYTTDKTAKARFKPFRRSPIIFPVKLNLAPTDSDPKGAFWSVRIDMRPPLSVQHDSALDQTFLTSVLDYMETA
jgi:hypothetical protein